MTQHGIVDEDADRSCFFQETPRTIRRKIGEPLRNTWPVFEAQMLQIS
ncbi:hypothetical protein [Mesorhizobium sp.]|nr:hypothetical protein [Mesorhizobium sp.]